jgi:hypothetical protein
MTWSALLVILLPLVGQAFGPLVQKLLERLLPKSGSVPVGVTAAPDTLKNFLRDMLVKQIESRLAFAPALKSIVLAVVKALDGMLLDMLWDKLFQQNLVLTPAPVKVTAKAVQEEVAFALPVEAEAEFAVEFGEN